MGKISRKITAAGVATALLFGGAVAMAPTASAVGSSACTQSSTDKGNHRVGNNVNFRTGPGTKYTSKGLLLSGTGVRLHCSTPGWLYVTAKSGAHKGKKGWVSMDYVTGLFNM